MCVLRTTETVKQRWTFVVHRLDDIVHTVDVRCANHLNVRCRIAHLYHQRRYILINIRSQHGLYEQHVRAPLQRFQHAQVVNVSVTIEIKVRDDIRVGVQDHLKLLHAVRLRESRCYGLQVKIQAYILCERSHFDGCSARCLCTRISHSRAHWLRIDNLGLWLGRGLSHHYRCCRGRLSNYNGLRSRRNGHDTGYTTACQHKWQSKSKNRFFHIQYNIIFFFNKRS